VTVTAGQTATFLLQVSDGGNGYTGTASFSCSGAPLGATCTVSPSSVSISTTPSPFKVVVTTTGASSASLQTRGRPVAWAFAFSILIAALLPSKMRGNASLRTTRHSSCPKNGVPALLCLIVLAASFSGCGGGSAAPPPPPALKTQPGSYGLTITGTTGNAQNNFVVILTVN
jgi:hypothetical protein